MKKSLLEGKPKLRTNKWYVLALLMVVGLFNYIDRMSISILQVPIKEELGLTDTHIGILTGLAFSLVYTTMSIPIARLADRFPRKLVIATALAIWSLMTALCGLTVGFVMLVVLRMGVAIGEAGCAPASYSLISDYFHRGERATVIGAYGLIFPLGTLLGFSASGWLASTYGWRETFVILGVLGLFLVPVLLTTLREPVRGELDGAEATSSEVVPFMEALGTLWNSLAFRFLIAGGALMAYPLNAAIVWNAAFYHRVFDMPITELAVYLALLSGGAGAVGLFGSGVLADRLGRRDIRWYMWVPGLAGIMTVPFMFAQYFASSAGSSLLLGIVPAILMNSFLAPKMAVSQNIVSPNLRAFASASIIVCSGFVGTVLGPLLTGVISDFLIINFDLEKESLRYAIFASSLVGLVGAGLLLYGARYMKIEFQEKHVNRLDYAELATSRPGVRE